MERTGIQITTPIVSSQPAARTAPSKPVDVSEMTASFGNVLENALQSVEQQEQQVRNLSDRFIAGQLPDIHTLVIASEKAHLGLQLTVQVRNKVIEAYQEIMRTQL